MAGNRLSPGSGAARKWWDIFGDPQLDELEEEVTQSNQDLTVAEARFRQARATIRFNRSAEFPTISTSPGIVNERFSANQPYFLSRWRTMGPAPSRCLLISDTNIDLWGRFAVGECFARRSTGNRRRPADCQFELAR